MNFLQLSWRELVGATLVNLQLILQFQFFQKPENSVASGLLQPGVKSVWHCVMQDGSNLPVERNFTALVVVSHFV